MLIGEHVHRAPGDGDNLDLTVAEGRVDVCQTQLVTYNNTCTCDDCSTWQSNGTHSACAPCVAGSYKKDQGAQAAPP